MKPYLGMMITTWLLAVALARPTADAFGDTDSTRLSLGLRYFYGEGVQQDPRKAEELFDGMDAKDQEALALMFQMGAPPVDRGNQGHAPDLAVAARWHLRAAERGDIPAQAALCGILYDGEGIPQNFALAAYWCQQAAEKGDHSGQLTLGEMYEKGQAVLQGFVTAYMWYNLAATGFSNLSSISDEKIFKRVHSEFMERAISARDALARRMTSTQLAEGQRLAKEWRPK
jgi:TPR repeat protein